MTLLVSLQCGWNRRPATLFSIASPTAARHTGKAEAFGKTIWCQVSVIHNSPHFSDAILLGWRWRKKISPHRVLSFFQFWPQWVVGGSVNFSYVCLSTSNIFPFIHFQIVFYRKVVWSRPWSHFLGNSYLGAYWDFSSDPESTVEWRF